METLWTINDIASFLQVSRRTAEDVVTRDSFPPRVRITARSHRWWPAQVIEWARRQQDRPTTPRRVTL